MRVTLSNQTGNGPKPLVFEVDFVIMEPECMYLCNGDSRAWDRNEKYIPRRYERALDDDGQPIKHKGEQVYQAGSRRCIIEYKVMAVQTAGRKYWDYQGTWYPHFSIDGEPPRTVIQEIEAMPTKALSPIDALRKQRERWVARDATTTGD